MTAIRIGNREYLVETAVTPEEHRKGLSGREFLTPGTGMLFVFGEPVARAVWMEDTRFPLDVLWLDAERKAVHLVSLPACRGNSFEEAVSPVESWYVLEIPGGEIGKNGFSEGDFITII